MAERRSYMSMDGRDKRTRITFEVLQSLATHGTFLHASNRAKPSNPPYHSHLTSSASNMPPLSPLCPLCRTSLTSLLPAVLTTTLAATHPHHPTLSSFRHAALTLRCYICAKLWNAIDEGTLARWATYERVDAAEQPNDEHECGKFKPFTVDLHRRTWAADWFGAVYWHIVYLEFGTAGGGWNGAWKWEGGGGVFCLYGRREEEEGVGDEEEQGKVEGRNEEEEKGEPFESWTGSEEVHQQAYEWYRACLDNHQTCRKLCPKDGYTPTRLINVGGLGDRTWKLRLYPDDIHDPPDYITLSYRWDPDPSILLLKSTIETFRAGLPISALPQTFQDAITVARRFKIRHMWIDSLCIIQDSPEDWSTESQTMHKVYAASALTLSATACSSPTSSLFRTRQLSDVRLGCIELSLDFPADRDSTTVEKKSTTKLFDIWDQSYLPRITLGPLTYRGWIFQERVLSPRVLHFAREQLAWECVDRTCCEMWPGWAPRATDIRGDRGFKTLWSVLSPGDVKMQDEYSLASKGKEEWKMGEEAFKQWNHLLQTYSACKLTNTDDRLTAMSGVAALFSTHTGDEYLAGLWRSRLVECLNWVVTSPVAAPTRFRAPSWSWAAVNGIVFPQPLGFPRDDDLIEVVDVNVKQGDMRCVHGTLTLRGCLTSATITSAPTEPSPHAENIAVRLANFEPSLYVLPDTLSLFPTKGEIIHLLPLRSTLRRRTGEEEETSLGTLIAMLEGMVLERADGVKKEYRRVGRFVLADVECVEFLGLRAEKPFPTATVKRVRVDEGKTSIITLV